LFIKSKILFTHKLVIWHQIIVLYGKKVKKLVYKNNKSKIVFNSNFFNFLIFLEMRLNIFLLRLNFFSKLFEANNFINNNRIFINKRNKKYNYLIKKKDVVQCFFFLNFILKNKKFRILKWKNYIWRKWKSKFFIYKNKKKIKIFSSIFWLVKKNIICNYIEINYKIFSAIIIKKPLIGDILLNNNNKILFLNLLKKIFYIY